MRLPFASLSIVIFLLSFGCQKNDGLPTPKNIRASQGIYINLVIVEWDSDINEPDYLVWSGTDSIWYGTEFTIKETRFVDYGDFLASWDVERFKRYYRVFTIKDLELKSESAKTEGFSANIQKAMVTGITRTPDQRTITVSWKDENPAFLNELSRRYKIKIAEESEEYATEYDYFGTNYSFQLSNRKVDVKYKASVTIEFTYDPYHSFILREQCQCAGDFVLEN